MKINYGQVMDFIAIEVKKEIKHCHWNDFDELGLNRQLDDYLKELKKRIAEQWKGLE